MHAMRPNNFSLAVKLKLAMQPTTFSWSKCVRTLHREILSALFGPQWPLAVFLRYPIDAALMQYTELWKAI